VIPSEAVHAIGPDAVTIRQSAVAGTDTTRLEALPKGSDVIGRKVVSEEGRFMGKVNDVLINRKDGHIVGYLLSEHTPGKKLEAVTGGDKKRRETPYLPADAKIKAGRDLIVASEESVNYEWIDDEESDIPESGPSMRRWGYGAPASPIEAGTSSDWSGTRDEDIRETNPRVR
jgi:sporulation protein YlmC with PRC-barrel domain